MVSYRNVRTHTTKDEKWCLRNLFVIRRAFCTVICYTYDTCELLYTDRVTCATCIPVCKTIPNNIPSVPPKKEEGNDRNRFFLINSVFHVRERKRSEKSILPKNILDERNTDKEGNHVPEKKLKTLLFGVHWKRAGCFEAVLSNKK